MTLPTNLPILSSGKQAPGSGKVCAEQAVNWLVSGRLDLGDETDHPSCVHPVLNSLAIAVNDRLPDSRRGEMWPLILEQPGTVRPDMEPVLSVRLAAWCATQVLDLAGTARRDAEKAIAASLAWCDKPCPETADAAHAAATAAHAAAYDAHAAAAAATATAAAYAAAHAAHAAAAAAADAAADDAGRLLGLLAGAQAEHRRLTGHQPAQVDTNRLERLGQLVGLCPVGAPMA